MIDKLLYLDDIAFVIVHVHFFQVIFSKMLAIPNSIDFKEDVIERAVIVLINWRACNFKLQLYPKSLLL